MTARIELMVTRTQELIVTRCLRNMEPMVTNEREKQLQSFARRFNDALSDIGVPPKNAGRQVVVAEMFGVSQKGARKWLEGEAFPARWRLNQMAEKTGRTIEWLLGGETPQALMGGNVTPGPAIRSSVPLISWVQAGHWAEIIDNYHVGDYEKLIITTKNVGPSAFALRVSGDSMEPEFAAGSIIVVDPDQRAENGSYVVVRLDDQAEATFKQLVVDAGKQYLKPLNPRYPIMEINGNATICGVVRQSMKDYD